VFFGICANGLLLYNLSAIGFAGKHLGVPHVVEGDLRADGTSEARIVYPDRIGPMGEYEVRRHGCHSALQAVYPQGTIHQVLKNSRGAVGETDRMVPMVDVPAGCRDGALLTEGKEVCFPLTHPFDFMLRVTGDRILQDSRVWASSRMKRFPIESTDERLHVARKLALTGQSGLPPPDCAWPDTSASQGLQRAIGVLWRLDADTLKRRRLCKASWVDGRLSIV
jgi:hypothetical protein